MKKSLVLALAVLGMVSQAHAAPEGKEKSRGREAIEGRERFERFAKSSSHTTSTVIGTEIGKKIDSSKIAITAESKLKLEKAASNDAGLKSAIEKALTRSGSNDQGLRDLSEAQIRVIAHLDGVKRDHAASALASLDANTKDSQIIADLAMFAGEEAAVWKDAKARENVTILMTEVANLLDAGKSKSEALDGAIKSLKEKKGVVVKKEEISELCKQKS